MRKRSFFITWIFFIAIHCLGQDAIEVDYKQIKENVQNQPAEFEALLKRYEANDSLLTPKDFSLIYFGYSYTPSYEGSMGNMNDFDKLLKEGKQEEAYLWGKNFLVRNPVSLNALYKMYILSKDMNKSPHEVKGYIIKYLQLLNMLSLTGDGQSEETAYNVICVNDEYHILRVYWKVEKIHSQTLVEPYYDMIEFEPVKNYKGNKMYFNVRRSLESLNDLFK